MTYLDLDRLAALDAAAFRQQEPFPWANPRGLLTDHGYRQLVAALPDVSMFKHSFGYKRIHGQQSHDRYALEYTEDIDIPGPWQEFIAELRSEPYRAFVKRMFGITRFDMYFHWHYALRGCSVSPHCDAQRKVGSHIFYLNTPEDWDPAWGGETRVLFDNGRFKSSSAPRFEDFDRSLAAETLGNYSFLFQRTPHSWHGVRELACPEGRMRKIFIAVINKPPSPSVRLRRLVGNLPKAH